MGTTYTCPNDAAAIPLVAEASVKGEVVRFVWCRWCLELFAVRGDGRTIAGFAADPAGGWQLFRSLGTDAEVAAVRAAVRGVPVPR